jgi:hypothetical protein
VPGGYVSIDKMISPVPGIVAQMKCNPTRDGYNCSMMLIISVMLFTEK